MKWNEVESSNLNKVAYYEGDLHVEFKTGAQYKYYAVPFESYVDLLECSSVGRFINQNIKGKFIYEKTREADPKPVADEQGKTEQV